MATRRLGSSACYRFMMAGRRRSANRGILLFFIVLLVIIGLTAAMASADSNQTSLQKGKDIMQQAATPQMSNIPCLDALEPARVETFTFGLG
jgi:hypothetical protein